MNPQDRTSPHERDEDRTLDLTLRPAKLAEFIGQAKLKDHLSVFLKAAKLRKEPIEHMLLHGGPGLGKTTLAHIIAREMNASIRVTAGPAIERTGDLAAILTNLEAGDVLFIDEIHRLARPIEEVLYPAMEEYALDIVLGKGPSARTMRLDLPRFTLIGATTKASRLSSPLRDRFGHTFKIDYYDPTELAQIVDRSSKILACQIEPEVDLEIARRARGTPRIANRLLKRIRDFAQVRHRGRISKQIAVSALTELDIDEKGLDDVDRRLLTAIIERFAGGPAGLNAIAAATGEEAETIEDLYEPFLVQSGFLARTTRGRVATIDAYTHLGKTPPADLQKKLI